MTAKALHLLTAMITIIALVLFFPAIRWEKAREKQQNED